MEATGHDLGHSSCIVSALMSRLEYPHSTAIIILYMYMCVYLHVHVHVCGMCLLGGGATVGIPIVGLSHA